MDMRTSSIRRLALIGDVHAEHTRLSHALEWLAGQNVDAVVCTGDLADGGGNLDVCAHLLDQAGAVCVAGNHDRWLLTDRVRHVPEAHHRSDLKDTTLSYLDGLRPTELLDTSDGPLLLCHGVREDDLGKVWPGTSRTRPERHDDMDVLLKENQINLMINGHLHYRVLIDFSNLVLINAGTLRGEHGGIAVIDFPAGEIVAYEFASPAGSLVRVAEHLLHNCDRESWTDTQSFDGCWTPVTLYGH
jgi:predicted phosphodiesterase